MTTEEVIRSYDIIDKKGFELLDIYFDIKQSVPDTDPNKSYEMIIHSLCISQQNSPWGTYYGPLITNVMNGKYCEYPTFDSITEDLLIYSEKRMREVKNPLLKLRYSSVCWDFMKKRGIKVPHDLFNIYVKSLIDVIDGDYENHPAVTVCDLRRLFSQQRNPQIKTVLRNFVLRNGIKDEDVGIWGVELDLILEYKKDFAENEINIVVAEHEARLARMIQQEIPSEFAIKEQVIILADYYKKVSDAKNIERVLKILEDVIIKTNANKSSLVQEDLLKELSGYYYNYSMATSAKKIEGLIQKVSAEIPKELETHCVEYKLSEAEKKALINQINDLTNGDNVERLNKFIFNFIIKKDNIGKIVEDNANKFPLWSLTPTQMFDEKGRPLSILGTVQDDYDGHLSYIAAQDIQFSTYILHEVIERNKTNECFTDSSIMDIVKKSVIIDVKRLDIINTAITFFLKKEYTIFCHLIIPQIEDAIRNIVEKFGGIVIKRQRSGIGYQLKTLDELLNDNSVKQVLSEDGVFYLRCVLTDQKGMNIRNNLCHGIASPQCFNEMAADRLFHVLMMLSSIHYVDSKMTE